MAKVWVGVVVLASLGCSSSGSTGSHSGGGSSSNVATAGAASGGGASAAGSSAGASAGLGGSAGAAGSGASPWPTDAAVAANPKTKGGACFLYAYDHCVRFAQCSATLTGDCLDAGDACPDLAFSEGSTRTVEGVVACARAWRAFSCEELLQGRAPNCATPGTKPVGEACAYSSQCSTLACDRSLADCGKCADVVGLDQDCSGGKGCLGSAVCNEVTHTCLPSSLLDPTVAGICNGGLCRQGSYCNTAHVCVANPRPGQRCGGGVSCDYPRDYCTGQDGTCQPAPGAGQPCGVGASAGSRYCAVGTSCVSETCVTLPADGEPCAFGNHCAVGFACDSQDIEVTGTCHRAAKGEPCTPVNLNCAAGLSCDGGVCKNPVGPEMPCSDGSTLCSLGTCDGSVCVPPDDQRIFDISCSP